MSSKNKSESSKESPSKKGSDDLAKQREIEEAQRRKEAEEKRREALLLEAKKKEAIEAEKREAEKRREQQIKVEPITVRNADGSVIVKDDHGRVVETKDAKGETRKFGFNDKGELNSFTENGKEWTSKDGQTWQAEKEKPRTLRAVVNHEDGTFATVEIKSQTIAKQTIDFNDNKQLTSFTDEQGKKWSSGDGQIWQSEGQGDKALNVTVNADHSGLTIAEAETQYSFVNGNRLIKNNSGSELRDKNNAVLESQPNSPAVENKSDATSNSTDVLVSQKEVSDAKQLDQPALSAEQKLEQIKQAATIIHENSADMKKVSDILEPMNEAERAQLKEVYKNQYNVELQDDLYANLSKPDAAQCEAVLKRKDGVADNSGHIHQALAKLEQLAPSEYAVYSGQGVPFTDGQVRAEKEVRDSISTLTAAQFAEVKTKYQNDYGRDLESDLLNDKNLSLQTKEALKIYFKGSDARTDDDTLNLADYALKQHRPDIFNDVFRDASPAAREKFKAADGYKRIEAAYVDEYGAANTADAQISKDFLDRGSVSIATITAGDTHWYHTNREDITSAMANASEQDRQDFIRGEELKLANESAKTPEDERALSYYNTVDKALHGAGDNREVAIWQAQLRNHGTFISEALSSRYEGFWFTGIGASTDKNKLIGSVENLGKTDWQYLKTHPEELKNVERALNTFGDNHSEQVMSMLQTKLKADSYEQSKTIGNRNIEESLNDCRDNQSRLNAIERMSKEERQRYLTNQDGLKDRLDKYFAPASERERYVFNAIVHEEPGQMSPVTRVILDDLKGGVKPAEQISHIEDAFKADPTLRERLANPQSEDDKKLSGWFHLSVDHAITNAGLGPRFTKKEGELIEGSDKTLKEYESLVFNSGTVPLEKKVLLTKDNIDRINVILHASPEDQARLLNTNPDQATKLFQDSVLGTAAQREVALYALSQRDQDSTTGQLSDADRFRLFALGDKVEQDSLRDTLAKMTPEQRQHLADEYYTKYHRLITSDVIYKVKEEDKWRFRELLSPTDISVRQIALDSQRALNSHTSDFDPFLKSFWDYSRVSADASQDKLNKFVTEHAKELDKLTPEQRKQFDDALQNFTEAQKNYINSKGEFAETFVNATITLAAIGGAVFTGGTSLTLLSAIGAGGAVYRVAMMKAIQGSDFDSSAKNIFKQGFEGGSAAVLGFLGPEQFGLKFSMKVGGQIAEQTSLKLVSGETSALFNREAQTILKTELANLTRQGAIVGDSQIENIAARVAASGVDKNVVKQAIAQQLKSDTMSGIKNVLAYESELYAKNLAAAQFGGQGKEILATAIGLESPSTLFERMKGNAVSTVVGVTMFHGVFRIASSGEYVKVALGKDSAGNLVAGEGTVIRRADGTIEQVVGKDKLVKLAAGDKIYESGVVSTQSDGTTILKVGSRETLLDSHGRVSEIRDTVSKTSSKVEYDIDRATNQVVISKVIVYTANGSVDGPNCLFLLDGKYVKWNANNEALPLASKLEIQADGTMVLTGSTAETAVGKARYEDSGALKVSDSITIHPDGSTTTHYADNVSRTSDSQGRIVELVNPLGVRTTYKYDAVTGQPVNITIGEKNYSLQNGAWYDSNNKLFADKIFVDKTNGYMEITNPSENIKVPARPNEKIASVTMFPEGETQYKYKGSTKAPVDEVTPPKAPSSEERLAEGVKSGELKKQSDGTFVREDVNSGSRTQYDSTGNVIAVRDSSGRDISFTRDGDGKLTTVQYFRDGKVESTFTMQLHEGRSYWREDGAEGNFKQWLNEVRVEQDGSVVKLKNSLEADDWTGIKERPDGLLVTLDKVGRERVSANDLATERAKVESLNSHFFKDPIRHERFDKWMKDFEARAAERVPPLSQEEIANTYYQLDKLISSDGALMSQAERLKLAESFMFKAVNPHTIAQGPYNTCNVTAEIQNRYLTIHPSEALQMVTDVATTGRFITSDGDVIDMTVMKNVLSPRSDTVNNKFDATNYGKRDMFDQIFQSTAVETYWQTQSIDGARRTSTIMELRAGEPFRPGDLRYEFTIDKAASETGEVINNYATNPPTRQVAPKFSTMIDPVTGKEGIVIEWLPAESPNLGSRKLLSIGNKILGRTEVPHILGRDMSDISVIDVNTTEELALQLSKMQENKVFPATIVVDSRDPLISGGTEDGGQGALHVVNVQTIFQKNGKWYVEVTNQWSAKSDYLGERAVPLEDLFRAMKHRAPEPADQAQSLLRKYRLPLIVGGGVVVGADALLLWRLMQDRSEQQQQQK